MRATVSDCAMARNPIGQQYPAPTISVRDWTAHAHMLTLWQDESASSTERRR